MEDTGFLMNGGRERFFFFDNRWKGEVGVEGNPLWDYSKIFRSAFQSF